MTLTQMATDAAQRHGVPPDVFQRVIAAESNWDPNAVNPKSGAAGLGQFLASTWREYGGGQSVYDPGANLEASARYIADLTRKNGGDLRAALRAYSGGAHYVDQVLAGPKGGSAQAQSLPGWMGALYNPPGASASRPMERAPGTGPDPLGTLPGRMQVDLMNPDLRAALSSAVGLGLSQGTDIRPLITSIVRTRAEQAVLYRKAQAGQSPYPAAPPGQSLHESGNAVDIDIARLAPAQRQTVLGLLQAARLHQPDPVKDPIHFELQGTGPQALPGWMGALYNPAGAGTAPSSMARTPAGTLPGWMAAIYNPR